MLLFTIVNNNNKYKNKRVSIHPMLLFTNDTFKILFDKIKVSIHPMLLFTWVLYFYKQLKKKCQYIPCYCSPLCPEIVAPGLFTCQYIPCYCSPLNNKENGHIKYRVNTSHVTVHQRYNKLCEQCDEKCQYIPCYCSPNDFKAFLFCLISFYPLF